MTTMIGRPCSTAVLISWALISKIVAGEGDDGTPWG